MPTDSAMENHQASISCYYISSTHWRFLVSQMQETHNCRSLHALPKGKINHVSKLISSSSPNGLAYWSENYLSFFLVIALCYICYIAFHHYLLHKTVWYKMHVSQKKKINGTISDMQNPIDHTNQVSANKHKSALNYGHSKNVCIYNLIGNNIFMEECTRDNINNWAIIPTGDFIHLFISNTEAPFLYYHTSRLLQIEGKKMSMYFQIRFFFAVADIVFCGWRCLWSCFCS